MACRTAATTSNMVASPGHRWIERARCASAGPWANVSSGPWANVSSGSSGSSVRAASVRRGFVGGAVELAPAQYLPLARPGAARAMPGGHRDDVAEARDHHGHVARGGGAVAELTVLVASPAADRAVLEHRAGVVGRAADRGHVAEALHLDRRLVVGPRAIAE